MKLGFTKRRCPKCGGNLFLDCAYYLDGNLIKSYEEETCLQCGLTCGNQIPSRSSSGVTPDLAIPDRCIMV